MIDIKEPWRVSGLNVSFELRESKLGPFSFMMIMFNISLSGADIARQIWSQKHWLTSGCVYFFMHSLKTMPHRILHPILSSDGLRWRWFRQSLNGICCLCHVRHCQLGEVFLLSVPGLGCHRKLSINLQLSVWKMAMLVQRRLFCFSMTFTLDRLKFLVLEVVIWSLLLKPWAVIGDWSLATVTLVKRRKLKLLMMWSLLTALTDLLLDDSCIFLVVLACIWMWSCFSVPCRSTKTCFVDSQNSTNCHQVCSHLTAFATVVLHLMPFTLIKHLLKYKHGVVGLVQLASICIRNQDACCCKLHVYLLPYRNFRRVTLIPLWPLSWAINGSFQTRTHSWCDWGFWVVPFTVLQCFSIFWRAWHLQMDQSLILHWCQFDFATHKNVSCARWMTFSLWSIKKAVISGPGIVRYMTISICVFILTNTINFL